MSHVLRHPERKAGTTTEPSELDAARSDYFAHAPHGEAADRSDWAPFAIAAGVAVAGVALAVAVGETAARWLTIVAVVVAVGAGMASHYLRRHNARLQEDNRKAALEILRRK